MCQNRANTGLVLAQYGMLQGHHLILCIFPVTAWWWCLNSHHIITTCQHTTMCQNLANTGPVLAQYGMLQGPHLILCIFPSRSSWWCRDPHKWLDKYHQGHRWHLSIPVERDWTDAHWPDNNKLLELRSYMFSKQSWMGQSGILLFTILDNKLLLVVLLSPGSRLAIISHWIWQCDKYEGNHDLFSHASKICL